jgi:hypothetical protein
MGLDFFHFSYQMPCLEKKPKLVPPLNPKPTT